MVPPSSSAIDDHLESTGQNKVSDKRQSIAVDPSGGLSGFEGFFPGWHSLHPSLSSRV